MGCAFLFLLAGLFRAFILSYLVDDGWHGYHGMFSMLYLGLLFQWIYSIRTRFIQREMRRYLTAVALLMIFWLVVRTVKYEFTTQDTTIERYLWYVYYIPFTMMPLLLFMATLYVGKTDQYIPDQRWKLLYIPAVAVVAGILTNDVHQQAFRFREDMFDWNHEYTHELIYYAAVGIFVLSLLSILILVIYTCTKKRLMKNLRLTGIVVCLGILYGVLYTAIDDDKAFIQKMYEFPEFITFFLIGFWESLVLSHLISSNTEHETFFRISSIYAGLTDRDYQVMVSAVYHDLPTKEEIMQAEQTPILFGDVLLKCHPVQGGHFFWLEDVEEILQVNRRLAETGDYLEQEHAVLDASATLAENRKRTEEQNRLCDTMARRLQPQLDLLESLLDSLPEEENAFRETMKKAGVFNAYIKRRSNLLLLGKQEIDSGELKLSVAELLSYIELCDISAGFDIQSGIKLPAEAALSLFELLENAVEMALSVMTHIFVTFHREGEGLKFYVELAAPYGTFPKNWNPLSSEKSEEALLKNGGQYEIAFEDDESGTYSICALLVGGDVQ